ncbi:cupin domain-containing protein (plasmid) [Rhizobium sullae]|uniref:Cupin domain-containing protein n=1 Tax=Rhizobium sullae TaxID=50338 RepID=A0A2N0DC00_RHISU|nr:cupin domain-containing protein [Rhizobium sullae]PKA43628.1 cupin domain-containing protein [Rhizobium sullae]UWU16740.1 cupin domain-containing protein [Rhizobium sullae]
MKTIHAIALALAFAGSGSPLGVARAEEPLQRTDLLKNDVDIPGRQVVQVRVDFAPGVLAARHSHPGEEVAYVLEGTLQYELQGRKPVVLTAGQSLFIPSGVVHSAKNVGSGKASELATYIVRKAQPLVEPAK